MEMRQELLHRQVVFEIVPCPLNLGDIGGIETVHVQSLTIIHIGEVIGHLLPYQRKLVCFLLRCERVGNLLSLNKP